MQTVSVLAVVNYQLTLITITVKTDISAWQHLSYSQFSFQKAHLHMVSIFYIHALFPLFKLFLLPFYTFPCISHTSLSLLLLIL